MEDKLKETTKKSIEKILDEGLNTNNLEHLYKLVDIYKDAKEVENMNYGNYGNYGEYGRRPGYDSYGRNAYGEYNNYGRRGYDMKYRGSDELDRMAGEYGRYVENRSRYGAGEETDKSFYHMVEAYKDFGKVLHEEAETPKQQQMLRDAIQSMMM